MLSDVECFSLVTTPLQSEPVSFAERSIDVCKQIQAMVWRNSRRNFQVYSVKNIFLQKYDISHGSERVKANQNSEICKIPQLPVRCHHNILKELSESFQRDDLSGFSQKFGVEGE